MRKELIILGAILPILVLIGAPNVFALSAEQRYNVGFGDGQSEAQADWNNNNPYNSDCPPGHTDAYCSGYQNGYASYWGSAQNNVNGNVQQSNSQSANIKVNGNNNRVTVNQQASNNDGEIGAGGHHHSSGSAINENCVVICLGVSVK